MPKDRAHKAKYYHAFNLMPSLGPEIRRLIRHFGSQNKRGRLQIISGIDSGKSLLDPG